MFFGRGEERKRRGGFGVLTLFRMLLSLTMMLVLFLAVVQALRYFSGNTTGPSPINNPKGFLLSLLTSEESAGMVKSLLNFTPPSNLNDLKGAIKDPNALIKTSQFSKSDLSVQSAFPSPNPASGEILKFAVVGDSHDDNDDLARALSNAKDDGAKFVIGVGDYTNVGTLDDLHKVKAVFDASGLPYYVTAGDHDLWDARNQGKNPVSFFNEVFGPAYQSFGDSGIRFILLYNSDNYDGVDETQMSWLSNELAKLASSQTKDTFVFMQEPLYHPTSDHFMGKVTPKLQDQAKTIAKMLADAKVGGVFYGDTHFFTKYVDPPTNLKMITTGAITRDRNLQPPRFVIVDVYQDGSYNITDTEVKQK